MEFSGVISHFALLIFTLSFFFSIGHLLFKAFSVKNTEFYYDFTIKTLLGGLFIVVVFSLSATLGKTYNWAILLIGILLAYINRKNINSDFFSKENFSLRQEGINFKKIVLIALAAFLFFALKSIAIYSTESELFISPLARHLITRYGRLSEFIYTNGIENKHFSEILMNKDLYGMEVYHYFEMWISSFLSWFSGLPAAPIHHLVTFPFFLVLLFTGYLALFNRYIKNKFINTLFAIVLPFTSCIYWQFLLEIKLNYFDAFHFIHGDHAIPFFRLKITVIEVILLSFILLFKNNKKMSAVFLLFCLAIISILTAPALLSALSLYALLVFIFIKRDKTNLAYYILPAIIIVTSVLVLSLILPLDSSFSGDLSYSFSEHLLAISVRFFEQATLYLPFSIILLICLFFYYKEFIKLFSKELCTIMGLIYLFAIFYGSIFSDFDWNQIYDQLVYPMAKITFLGFVFILSERIIKHKNKIFYLITIIPFLWLSFRAFRNMQLKWEEKKYEHSASYFKEVASTMEVLYRPNDIKIGAYYENPAILAEMVYSGMSHSSMYYKGTYLSYFSKNIDNINLNWIDLDTTKIKSTRMLKQYRTSPIIYFARSEKMSLEKYTAAEIQAAFLKKYKMKFIIFPAGYAIPKELNFLVKDKIQDQITKDVFYILK